MVISKKISNNFLFNKLKKYEKIDRHRSVVVFFIVQIIILSKKIIQRINIAFAKTIVNI